MYVRELLLFGNISFMSTFCIYLAFHEFNLKFHPA